jgi:RNA polymerase sigma factor (sigma-70 family)
MTSRDITKLTRKQLVEHFEQERQEWLAAGMSESDIFRIHFGEGSENGRGGDYRVWLDERRHTRKDHKYAPGTPISIDEVGADKIPISDERMGLDEVEFHIDLETALAMLPTAQRNLVEAIVSETMTPAEYARSEGISKAAVSGTLKRTRKNLRNFYAEGSK